MASDRADAVALQPPPTLCAQLREATRTLHTEVERSAFMRALLRGELERPAYARLLRNLHPLYDALETAGSTLAPLNIAALRRSEALAADLDVLHGPGWRDALPLLPAAVDYAAHLQRLARAADARLAAHAYVRYLGDLSGGQLLARIVADSLQPPPGAGTRFYDFGGPAQAAALARRLREALDELDTPPAAPKAIVAEAVSAFERHRALFEQLHAARATT